MLDLLALARRERAMVSVHAENDAMIAWMALRLLSRGHTAPKYHAVSHPRLAEAEAVGRLIAMAALVDQPVTVFHVTTEGSMRVIRDAQTLGQKVFAETCPQYLFLTADHLDRPGLEGAKWMFSPPARDAADQAAMWRGIQNGTFQIVSSDHAPYRFDETGKLAKGPDPHFKQIANGIPGIEARLPLLFSEGVKAGRIDLNRFVELCSTNPAKIYGLHPKKGTIAIGADADLAIWDPEVKVEVDHGTTHDATGYCPYAGMTLTGWPVTVISRGEVIVDRGKLLAQRGRGRLLTRAAGPAAEPAGPLAPELDPARNFGANLI
jgi:dihydropyrimidinase